LCGAAVSFVTPVWKTAVFQLFGAADVLVRRLAHRHEHDPITRVRRPRRTSDDVDDVSNGVEAGNRNASTRLEAFTVGMWMCIEESRKHRSTLEINEPR
jgi:hypothetical protein